MSRKIEKVLIIGDDKETLLGLSATLELDGFHVKTTVEGLQALVMAEKEPFDAFILNMTLPDINGAQLLAKIQSVNPKAIKIMIADSLQEETASEFNNKGANAYYLKPINNQSLLLDLKEKLRSQKTELEKKQVNWAKQRISKIQLNEYLHFAEETACLFGVFGLSKTQAKIYMALNALGVATASEIAVLSKIRREEVYRIMPELETRGIITSRLEAPRKFAATEPKTALNILVKMKVEEMDKGMLTLQQRKDELISRLLNTSFGIYEENSVEALSRQINVELRLSQMAKKARNQILFVGSINELKKIINETQNAGGQIKMRAVVSGSEVRDETGDSGFGQAELRLFLSSVNHCNGCVDLRVVAKRAFNLVIVDGRESIWGESNLHRFGGKVLWTNDSVQVGILKRAFENLWQEAVACECQSEVRTGTLF